jgi:antitoxin MazE
MKMVGKKHRARNNARSHARLPKAPISAALTRRVTVSSWGNSIGLRIPREGVEQLKLRAGAEVLVEIGAESITIKPDRKKWTEAELLRGIRPENVGGEIDWGGPVGKEVW